MRVTRHDYIHTSLKILEEITRRSGGIRLREDNVLFMLSTRLKDICNQYGIFIMSATQLNGDYKDAKVPDQNLLRGAKSIADKIDMGSILLGVTDEDLVSLDKILCSNIFDKPTIKISIYKNRRGRYKGVYLWCKADLGTCRIQPMFCTGYDYEKVDKAIKECQEPIIIMVGNETAMALISESEENNDIKVAEQEFEELITYKGIPITVNPILPFGFFLGK